MSLLNAHKGTKIIETLENYSIAGNSQHTIKRGRPSKSNNFFYDDQQFWRAIIGNSNHYWNKEIELYSFVLSDWVARVPGLYWADHSESIRRHNEEDIAVKSKDWEEFHPPGKSRKVLGGIGTILLPPDDAGKRLMMASSTCNASLGIPLLIFPEVIDYLSLKQGDVVNIKKARWQPINASWAQRFASTKDIPRGYLVIDKIDKIRVIKKDIPMLYHPFSIMEYQSKDALLYDFVFLTIDSKVTDGRKQIENFFEYYAKKDNRNGKYLLNTNMIEPMFDAQFMSPSEMHQPSQKAQLELIHKRIKQVNFDKTTLDKLIRVLPKHYDNTIALRRLAKSISISTSILQENNAASMSAQLINYCMDNNKIEELTDRMIVEYPNIFE
ncbi:MAG: hypothetical protein Q8K60_07815 [Parachlamydiaceae bacterium]|nr:hypothetical protein [Parachlamydiaceae bacterium]